MEALLAVARRKNGITANRMCHVFGLDKLE